MPPEIFSVSVLQIPGSDTKKQIMSKVCLYPYEFLRLLRALSEKYFALVGEIPCPLLLGEWFCHDAGSGKLICRVNSEFSSGKNQPPVVVS